MVSYIPSDCQAGLLFSRGQRHWRISRLSWRAFGSQQQPECEEMHPEKRWYIQHGDRVTGSELPGNRWQIRADRPRCVEDEIGKTDQIESPDQRPEKKAHAHRQQREDGEQCGG